MGSCSVGDGSDTLGSEIVQKDLLKSVTPLAGKMKRISHQMWGRKEKYSRIVIQSYI